jgi:hypothetical protein
MGVRELHRLVDIGILAGRIPGPHREHDGPSQEGNDGEDPDETGFRQGIRAALE